MREYNIRIPFKGYFDMTVEADNINEAVDIMFATRPDDLSSIDCESDFYEVSLSDDIVDKEEAEYLEGIEIEEGDDIHE